ncbi:MAG: pyruvate kinase [SAR324 cluster bacterium]|uniref:pyruvate kinase n=1 Tax=SAR324 cluster bacterium TaxID=2024889 RepID=A0A7X9FSA3_9DELT|nr:pyruvate kinase [SAR324 cluster bacterium]
MAAERDKRSRKHSVDKSVDGKLPQISEKERELLKLSEELKRLIDLARNAEKDLIQTEQYTHPDALKSAQNFAHYIGIRRQDLRQVQRQLHSRGLSSLGRMETHTLDSLQNVYSTLLLMQGSKSKAFACPVDYEKGESILSDRCLALLGPKPKKRSARIMVTMPSEAALDYTLVRNLVEKGMGVMRITCAHDGPAEWEQMIKHVRAAEEELGKRCLVMADLAGPKLRTSPMESGPGVIRWRAFKNVYGEVVEPAKIWLNTGSPLRDPNGCNLPVSEAFLSQLNVGDEIQFVDNRKRRGSMQVTEVLNDGVWAESWKSAFMVEGLELRVERLGSSSIIGKIGPIPPMPQKILLKTGDILVLTPEEEVGKAAIYDESGKLVAPAHIGCTLREVLTKVAVGERIFFDDGKIAGTVEEKRSNRLFIRINWTKGSKAWLSEEKGINLPSTELGVSALTDKDQQDLEFLLSKESFVDLISLSFVKCPEDIDSFYKELSKYDASGIGVIIKIENNAAFEKLPGIVLSALKRHKVGVMIARGDLGVEVGFERMAELQEEILSLCGAAHLPVVWATQVLESLAKKGMPSRAEVSDVVMGARTQCVMLNKGPHTETAVEFLSHVLERMEGHQDRHFRLLRKLSVADGIFS